MEDNTIKIRKDKIKNIAIIFLSVMLVLTFFSNSILNHSLPEVATEYVSYDTITERVRGTGTVTAQDPYKVMVQDSRIIESVAVSEGEMVMKDQVLFYLGEAESKEEEIKGKEDELNGLVLNYMKVILSGNISNEVYDNLKTNNIASLEVYYAKIEELRLKVQSAQDTVDSLNRQKVIADTNQDSQNNDEELELAEKGKASASEQMQAAEDEVTRITQRIKELEGNDLNGASTSASMTLAEKKSVYDEKRDEVVDILKSAEGEVFAPLTEEEIEKYFTKTDNPITDGLPMLEKIDELSQKVIERGGEVQLNELNLAYSDYISANIIKEEADSRIKEYANLKQKLKSAKQNLTNITNEYKAWESKLENLTKDNAEAIKDQEELIETLELRTDEANRELKMAEEEYQKLLDDIKNELDLSEQNSEIAELERELAQMKEASTGATVVAPVEGMIVGLNKTASEMTSPDEEIALIQVAGKEMTVSFSVTNDQAAKVKVGDVAELQNAWYYEDVMIILSKIKPDTEDPGKRKLLEFTVEGAVQSGEQLSLTVGEKSAEYDFVVPNSAIREDNNGKFILIIEEKSTPFGNRYKAKRVDVEVMASDETKTALSADLEGYEYVITTANQPVESGDQVRLADY